ncbi:MAG TPA: M48 family metallopeptidase [Myxococcota bacterium]
MIRLAGQYHDGQTSRVREVEVCFHRDGAVSFEGENLSLRVLLGALRVSPRVGRTRRVLTLPDGASCEVPDDDALDDFLAAAHRGSGAPRFVALLERHWPAALVAALVTLAGLASLVLFGVPALANLIAHTLPPAVDETLGEGALATLDQAFFAPSALDDAARAELREIFDSLEGRREMALTPQLVFRDGGPLGANAFALPSGIVVVTDQLVALANDTDQVTAVLAHELGHVAHRHALRSVLQQAGVAVMVAAAMGDIASISSLAATLPVVLVKLQYSRRFEREADAYAVPLLAESGVPPGALAEMLDRLSQAAADAELPEYLSTHPDTRERIRAIRGQTPGDPAT